MLRAVVVELGTIVELLLVALGIVVVVGKLGVVKWCWHWELLFGIGVVVPGSGSSFGW